MIRVFKSRKIYKEINNHNELLDYVNQLGYSVMFKSFGSNIEAKINKLINSNFEVSYKKFNTKIIRPIISKYSHQTRLIYWTTRGYTLEESKELLKNRQLIGANKLAENKKKNPEKYISNCTIEYYLNKGFDKDEAAAALKRRQATNTIESYIKKYGSETGPEKFIHRNKDWGNKIKHLMKDRLYDYESRGINFFNRISDNPIIDSIKYHLSLSFVSNSLREEYSNILNLHTIDKHSILRYINTLNIYSFRILSKSKLMQTILQLNKFELFEKYCKHNNITYMPTRFGRIFYLNGYNFSSIGELIIGIFLFDNNIEFKMHKKYPAILNDRRYDFYLPELNIYIEYMGMNVLRYTEKFNQLRETNLNIIWSNNIEHIKSCIKLTMGSIPN